MFEKLLHSSMRLSVFIFAIAFSIKINAQLQPECGTVITPEAESQFLQKLPELRKIEKGYQKNSLSRNSNSLKNYVPIKAHILRKDDGTGGLSENQLNDAIEEMNAIYEGAEMEFFICGGINYIDNTDYFNFSKSEESELTSSNNVDDVINIYFANTVKSDTGSNLCGYAYFPGGPETIMMKNSCATNGSTLSHEVGHFFALSHTHGNSSQSNELVNGSNCSDSGDYICDTPADPKLSYSNVNLNCTYTGDETDANNDTYVPDEENLMSYSRKECRNRFTSEQLARIHAIYLTSRSNLTCPDFNLAFEASYTSDCDNSMTVNFIDNSIGATAWQWDVDGDGIIDYTDQNPTHRYTSANKYNVSLMISNSDDVTIGEIEPEFINIGLRPVETSEIMLILNTDNRPSETTWSIKDNSGNVIYSGGPYQEGSQDEVTIREVFDISTLGECFSFEIEDKDNDGLIGFNSSGSYELRDGYGNLIVTGSDFGSSDLTYMTKETLSTPSLLSRDNTTIFPNPVKSNLYIKTGKLESLPNHYVIYTVTGRAVTKGVIQSEEDMRISVQTLRSGMYIIKMRNNAGSIALPFIKQ